VTLAGASKADAIARATEVLTEVGLGHRLHHLPGELSGGQQQRVAIARAIVNRPSILLADEPTANLDLNTGRQIIEMIRDLSRRHGVTVVTATHDDEILKVSDRLVWIADGQIERVANRDELEIDSGSMAGDGH